MNNTPKPPIRAGIFTTVDEASTAVNRLVESGFDARHISVVCSDERKEAYFEKYRSDSEITKTDQPIAIASGVAGGILGALVSLAGVAVTGGIGIAAVGPVIGGGITGTLVGIFVGHGVEDEKARFYEQSVVQGDILVTVEVHAADERIQQELLTRASRIFQECGTKPLPLDEG